MNRYTLNKITIALISITLTSTIVIPLNERGVISDESPSMRSMFEMLEPRILPSASCPLPFNAATMQVASSGMDVPAAIIVIAMNLSDTPRAFAISVAELTKRRPPNTRPARPPKIIIAASHVGKILMSESSSSWFPFLNDDQRYQMNIPSMMAPSTLHSLSSPAPNMVRLSPSRIRSAVTIILRGMSFLRLFLVIVRGAIKAVTPRISSVLNMLDPTILPMAISAFPCMADSMLTTISGAEVPMPTMVTPMMNSLSPNFFAMLDAPSTR